METMRGHIGMDEMDYGDISTARTGHLGSGRSHSVARVSVTEHRDKLGR